MLFILLSLVVAHNVVHSVVVTHNVVGGGDLAPTFMDFSTYFILVMRRGKIQPHSPAMLPLNNYK